MNKHLRHENAVRRYKRNHRNFFAILVAILLSVTSVFSLALASPAHADIGDVTIVVVDRDTGQPIPEFRYIINEDITHQPEDGTQPWSTNPKSYSPIVAHGDQDSATTELPDGKYLVSVMGGPFPPAPGGYKMSGKHFTVSGSDQNVTVELVSGPLPLAAMTVQVHSDNMMVNGAWDPPIEQGLEGFAVLLEDGTGEVTVDFYGNPICTEYDNNGNPIPGTGGQCLTDENGLVTIPNLPPLKYGAFAIPPNGSGWVQTSTIEGTNVIDAWLEEGTSGFTIEEGFAAPMVSLGFVQECEFGLCPQVNPGGNLVYPNTPTPPQGSGSITGRIREGVEGGAEGVVTPGKAVYRPYVALNNLSGNDEQVYTGRGDEDGTFFIPNVPDGLYQLVIWDFPQLYIISFETVQVTGGQAVDVGDILVPRWFGQIQGYAYFDDGVTADGTVIPGGAENGIRDCYDAGGGIDPYDVDSCEKGIPGQDLDVRFNDGSIKYAAFTDANGYYDFPTHFPYGHFLIWEVGFGRMKQMSTAGYFTEFPGDGLTAIPTGYPYNPQNRPGCGNDPECDADFGPASLLQAQITLAGFYNWIDTGKANYGPGENGGIAGLVVYAATRNEYDPRIAAAEDYEPGIPNATINLYQAALDAFQQPIACTAQGPGCPYGEGELMRVSSAPGPDPDFGDLIDSVMTDSYDANHPTECIYPDLLGGTISDPFVPGADDCLEVPINLRQIKDGVFDGGFAFEGVPAGAYIVELAPLAHYRQIKEEDQNTDQGDDFIPQVPPPPCAGPLHLVNDARNPADGQMTPLCDSKFVRVVDGTNPPAEFYVMTDFDDSVDEFGDPVPDFGGTAEVPPPGLMRGILFDDLNVEFNPNSPMFQGKRGVANTPVGILDFQGNEIAVVNTDDEGFFEVLLPSSYTRLCPTPGGVCPAMYRVVGNYPGQDPLNPLPNWNPAYSTLTIVLDIWSGKTTYADVAITPTSGFGFDTPPVCTAIGPNVQSVDTVHGPRGTSFNIYGSGFGNTAGSVTVGSGTPAINSWTDTAINVTLASNGSQPRGAQQLLVTDAAGVTGESGITFHVTGGSGGNAYNPNIIDVFPDPGMPVIQDAIDAASAGSLIVVHPGEYFESPIVYKGVKLQGYGPGVTSIDGRLLGFGPGAPFDTTAWEAKIASINPVGPQGGGAVPIGQVVTFVATGENTHQSGFRTQIDGFTIIGGSRNRAGDTAILPVQGGGIYAHARVDYLQVSNNTVQSNAGNFGGGIILGQAYLGNNFNNDARIHHNRVLNNGGFVLAGGIAIFNDADNYEIDHNVICGNESAEYGGGISHYGLSNGGMIYDNRIVFNSAFDEGGGIMVAGELQEDGSVPPGSGDVFIQRNLIQGNLSNDDGGGIRLLSPVDGYVRIENNMIVDNMATDLGGGISLDDALDVEIVNNTIARNVTTATAEDSDGNPHGAGITSEGHSAALLATLGNNDPVFSDPKMINNILWHNEAWYLDVAAPLNPVVFFGYIDLEVFGTTTTEYLTPHYSLLTYQPDQGTNNIWDMDPLFVDEITLAFDALPLIGEPAFIGISILTTPADNQGDYHLSSTASPAWNMAADHFGNGQSRVDAPENDFDSDPRPGTGNGQPTIDRDIGADEIYP